MGKWFNKSLGGLGGVKVSHCKNTAESPTVTMPVPDSVTIPMVQHMGIPCEVTVKVGDEVKVGQVIGETDVLMSAPIHASVSGKVTGITEIILSSGEYAKAVVIACDKLQTVDDSVKPPVVNNHADFVKAIRASGLVGLGGAGFPAHIKFSPKNLQQVDTLVINGAECEPYITSDYRTMLEDTDAVLSGIKSIQKYLNLKKVVIGIENNKPDAIKKFSDLTAKDDSITVMTLRTLYPQGAEKVLIYETTGKTVMEGQLPSDVGVIVSNITTAAFVHHYLKTGMPLIAKCLTVDGGAVALPKNVIAPIGTPFIDIINFCGGYKNTPKKLIMGGPMMGIAVYDDHYPLIKNNNAILVFDEKQAKNEDESPCIRCGRCVNACPYKLMPFAFDKSFQTGDIEELKARKINLCMECGCCSYVCPAKRHLVLTNRLAKKLVRESK